MYGAAAVASRATCLAESIVRWVECTRTCQQAESTVRWVECTRTCHKLKRYSRLIVTFLQMIKLGYTDRLFRVYFIKKVPRSIKIKNMWWVWYMVLAHGALGYWDSATTTVSSAREDKTPRQSFFTWLRTEPNKLYKANKNKWDWNDLWHRRQLNCIAGISIDFLPLGTAVILNHRTLITSANYLDPWLHREKDLRIWALGYQGLEMTPYRYRVWRVRRLIPRSVNFEHCHGSRCGHVPRHDVAIIHSMDQIYISQYYPISYHWPYRAILTGPYDELHRTMRFTGSGYESLTHIAENYKIIYHTFKKEDIVDCSEYIPKWWGKFICAQNKLGLAAIPNGGGLFTGDGFGNFKTTLGYVLVGLGCFEIRINEKRIMVFTDLRYYVRQIIMYANYTPGDYYEYAYPEFRGWEKTPTFQQLSKAPKLDFLNPKLESRGWIKNLGYGFIND